MIKVKNGKCILKGSIFELTNEYGVITKAMAKMMDEKGVSREITKKLLTDIVEDEFLTEEEIKQKLLSKTSKMIEDISEKLREMYVKEGADNE